MVHQLPDAVKYSRPGLRLVPGPGHTRGSQVVIVETGGRSVVIGGDMAVFFAEVDEPRTEGQPRVRALNPAEVWLSHQHEPGPRQVDQDVSFEEARQPDNRRLASAATPRPLGDFATTRSDALNRKVAHPVISAHPLR